MQPRQYNTTSARRYVPMVIGAIYQLVPDMGGQYVVLANVDRRYVYLKGFEHTIADIKIRKQRFSDIVIKAIGYGTEGSCLRLTSEAGYVLMLSGDRIRLMNQGAP